MARFADVFEFPTAIDGRGLRVGIVVARFNAEIGESLLKACIEELQRLGVAGSQIVVANVPGSLEVPLALQKLANSGKFDTLIALGAVIRGDTYHFEVVANESAGGIMSVQLDTGIPVANGILTCDTEEQANSRAPVKGKDCAQAAVEMVRLMKAIDERQ
ncbi:MAG: 6,7-dimethyl-8-ribityllumazine synthase [Burkholderiales bacterium]